MIVEKKKKMITHKSHPKNTKNSKVNDLVRRALRGSYIIYSSFLFPQMFKGL